MCVFHCPECSERNRTRIENAHALDEGSRAANADMIVDRLARHAEPDADWDYRSKLIDGAILDPRFVGKTFEPLGGVCLDLDSPLGIAEWSDYANWGQCQRKLT